MFIIKLRVLKGNVYFEGVGAIGLASMSLYLIKYLLPEEELGIYVLDGSLNG